MLGWVFCKRLTSALKKCIDWKWGDKIDIPCKWKPKESKSSCIYIYQRKWSEVAQSCPTLCDPIDCSLPGSSVHEIFQARVLEWVAIPSPDLQRIFLTQGSNPGLPHFRQMLYHLSHQGSLCISEKTDLKPKTVAKTKKFSLYNGKGIILTRGYSSCKQLRTQHETT